MIARNSSWAGASPLHPTRSAKAASGGRQSLGMRRVVDAAGRLPGRRPERAKRARRSAGWKM